MTLNFFRRTIPHLALATALGCSTLASASLITYDLTGATTSVGTVTGTVTLNSLNGQVTAADITFNDIALGSPVFLNIGSPNSYNELGQDYISGPSNSSLNYGGQIALYYDLTNLASDGDLNICLSIGSCGTESNQASYVQVYTGGNGGPFLLTGGSLDPVGGTKPAITPEPKSLLLLGSGMASLAALLMVRSRRLRTPGNQD